MKEENRMILPLDRLAWPPTARPGPPGAGTLWAERPRLVRGRGAAADARRCLGATHRLPPVAA